MKLTQLFNIKHRVIIITGGSGFLGQNYINFFKELHATVINFDIHHHQPVDITNEQQVKKNVDLIVKKYGKIDVLINNASLNIQINRNHLSKVSEIDFFAPVSNYPLIAFKKGLEIDLVGSFIVSKQVFPHMKQNKGVIINIGSIYGILAPDQRLYKNIRNPLNKKLDINKPFFYSITKAGMWGLTRYLAAYGAPEIRVNQLTLGGIQHQENTKFIKKYADKTMLKRMGKISDIYGALLFLSTDASAYMTGANLIIDGGYTAW